MTRKFSLWRILAVLLTLSLLAAACGDDDDDTPDTSDDSSADDTGADDTGDAGDDDSNDDTGDDDSSADDGGDDGAADGGDAAEICAFTEAGPVTIVHLTDISGESPTAIDDFWNGSQLAAAELNAACGEGSVELERIPTDFSVDGLEPNLLEAQEREPTAIISQGSSSQMTLNNLVDEGGIPVLWPVGTATGLIDGENGSEWSWMVRVVNDTQGKAWGTHIANSGFESVWLECVQTQLGVSGCGEAEPILNDAGIAIAGRSDSAFDESDFTTSMVDLEAAGADVVLLAQFPSPLLAFAQQMEDNGLLDDAVMFGSTSTEVVYRALSPAQQDNMIALADCNPREDDPEANDAFNAEYDIDMSSLAAVAYDAVYLVADAAGRTGGTDPASIAEGLSSTSWDGVCQDYFDSGSHALAHRMVVTGFDGGVITTEAEYQLNDRGDGLAG